MENFIVSARKYRPATFESVVGQASITKTLKNSIKNNYLAQAYLFCGPRGVGKTTCARIFAKTINCTNITSDFEACNECESCKAFNKNSSYNIHELDAASNNSVDDIRTLIDKVRIPPQIGKYGIYIIDEVHMLSAQAFNAFLKTLEEPPAHAKFILATTEKHKIIPTILSRCQIYDFNRIKITDISDYIAFVAGKEKIEIEPEAVNIISLKADGAMRDALSIFDQIVSFAGNKITYKDVIDNLNVLDYDYYFKLTDSFLKGELSDALLTFNEILEEGFDALNFIVGLSVHFRDLLVCKDKATHSLLEVGASIRDNYILQSEACDAAFLIQALQITNAAEMSYKPSTNKRLTVELALMKLCRLCGTPKEEKVLTVEKITSVQKPTAPKPIEKKVVSESVQPETQPKQSSASAKNKSIPSIKANLTQTKEVKEDTPAVEKAEEESDEATDNLPIVLEDLHAKWKEYASGLGEKPRLQNMMINYLPEIQEEGVLHLAFDNKSQEDSFAEVKTKVENYLKKELSNSTLKIQITITEREEERKLYTDSDKLNYLKEKNPNMTVLQQKFNLDFGNV